MTYLGVYQWRSLGRLVLTATPMTRTAYGGSPGHKKAPGNLTASIMTQLPGYSCRPHPSTFRPRKRTGTSPKDTGPLSLLGYLGQEVRYRKGWALSRATS